MKKILYWFGFCLVVVFVSFIATFAPGTPVEVKMAGKWVPAVVVGINGAMVAVRVVGGGIKHIYKTGVRLRK